LTRSEWKIYHGVVVDLYGVKPLTMKQNRNYTVILWEMGFLLIVIIIVILFLNYYRIINLNKINSFLFGYLPQDSIKTSILHREDRNNSKEDMLPVPINNSDVKAVSITYTLTVTIREVNKIDSNSTLTFSDSSLPAITLANNSYVRRMNGGKIEALKVSDIIPGTVILSTFYYYPFIKQWASEDIPSYASNPVGKP
jgi:hypothetical protein